MTAGVLVVLVALSAAGVGPKSGHPEIAIDLFASEPAVVTPVGIAVDSRGRVLVVESHTHFRPDGYRGPTADRIRVLEDRDRDGRAEVVSDFYEGSKFTMGLAFHPDGPLYVATRYEVFRLRDDNGDGRADGPPEPVVKLDTPGDYPHNGLSGVAFDAEGRVYFGLGENLGASYKLVGRDGTTLSGGGEGGSVFRCRPDGTGLERVATGFWNPFHVAFDPYGRLFAVDNDPDSRPPCRLIHVVPGGDYGYRFRNGRKGLHPFTAWNGELPGTLPMAAGTGEAPSGVLVYGSDHLPKDLGGNLLVTSWGDHRIDRFRPKAEGATLRASGEPLVSGGEDFRPVGIAAAPDGSVYVSDWVDKSYTLHGKGRVWRLRSKLVQARALPATLADALGHADRATREAAARRLGAGGEAGHTALRRALTTHTDPLARTAALDALVNTATPADDDALAAALGDRSEDIREQAVRRLPERIVAGTLSRVAADASALVRAEALRRLSRREDLPVIFKALEDSDPFTRQAAREGLKRTLKTDEVAGLLQSDVPERRLGGLLVLRESGEPASTRVLGGALIDPDPSVRFVAIQWVGEAKLEAYRPALKEGLGSGTINRNLFAAYLAALERLDGKTRDPKDEQPGESYVASLLTDVQTPALVQQRALLALRPDHPAVTLEWLGRTLRSSEPDLQSGAVKSLREGTLPGRFALLERVAGGKDWTTSMRAEAVVGLGSADLSAASSRSLLVELAAGRDPTLRREALRSLRGAVLTAPERARVLAAAGDDPESSALIEAIGGWKSRPEGSKPEPLPAWLAKLEGPADPAAGARVFFHPKGPGCYRCHQVEGRGGRVGPDLSTTGTVLTRERLVESIVDPSKEVAPQFVAHAVALRDGRVVTGTFLESTEAGHVYADSQGKLVTVKPSEIEEDRPLPASIMPAELPGLMTTQEFRDLIAFLRSPRGGP